MKYFLYPLILILSFQSIAQTSNEISAIVTYKIKLHEDLSEKPKKQVEYINEMYENAKDTDFVLTLNSNQSIFLASKGIEVSSNPAAHFISSRVVAGGSYYTDLKNETVLIKKVVGGEEIIVSLEQFDTNDWELTNETKLINNYKCFKASRKKIVENYKGTFSFEIEAWFAPELPGRFGPKEFSGLPGIVLELKDTHYTFYVEKIEFLNTTPKIKPFKGKVVTESEYLEIIQKNLTNFKERIKKN